jgi:hypothetical protein
MKYQEHQVIYLEPSCGDCHDKISRTEGQLWCEDPQTPCDLCGKQWVKYAIAEAQLPPLPKYGEKMDEAYLDALQKKLEPEFEGQTFEQVSSPAW